MREIRTYNVYTQHNIHDYWGVVQRRTPFTGPYQLTWKDSYDLFHLFLKSDLEDTICFIDDETVEVLVHESWSILKEVGRGRLGEGERERERERERGRGREVGREGEGGREVVIAWFTYKHTYVGPYTHQMVVECTLGTITMSCTLFGVVQ